MTLWLSSFPRSGNTLLRQVLHAGWGMATGSVFGEDLGDNLALIRACGHVELRTVECDGGRLLVNPHDLPVKTHLLPWSDGERAVYILRDGRAACVSLWQFWKGQVPLEDIVCGRFQFGSWSDHVLGWTEGARIEALLRYEELVGDPGPSIRELTRVFGEPVADPATPLRERALLAARDGTWVRPETDWREHWSPALEELFMRHNEPAFTRFYGESAACSIAA